MKILLIAVRSSAYALVVAAAVLAAWRFDPWLGAIVIATFVGCWVDVVARCHQLRLKHEEDVEAIGERDMPRIQQLMLSLERRVRELERNDIAV